MVSRLAHNQQIQGSIPCSATNIMGGVPMNERADDVKAQIYAILDIVNNNYAQAIKLVCDDIEIKESKEL